MRINWIVIVLAFVIVVMGFFQFKSCNKKSDTVDVLRDLEVDSIKQKAVSDSLIWHKEKDSLALVNASLMADKREVTDLADMRLRDLKEKDVIVRSWADSVKMARERKDTVANLAACDSLGNEYDKIRQIAINYVKENDTLKKINDSIIQFKNAIITRLDGLYSNTNNSLFETSRLYGNQGIELKAAKKDAGKRWGIGPSIGVAYVGGSIKPTIEIGIHYDIFKF